MGSGIAIADAPASGAAAGGCGGSRTALDAAGANAVGGGTPPTGAETEDGSDAIAQAARPHHAGAVSRAAAAARMPVSTAKTPRPLARDESRQGTKAAKTALSPVRADDSRDGADHPSDGADHPRLHPVNDRGHTMARQWCRTGKGALDTATRRDHMTSPLKRGDALAVDQLLIDGLQKFLAQNATLTFGS